MEKKFKSKIGKELVGILAIVFTVLIVVTIVHKIWILLFLLFTSIAFFCYVFLNTYYTITNNELNVRCGFLLNLFVEINSIRKIEETYTALSSPALSMDKLEIFYNKFDSILISPKEKQEFIDKLLELNSNIKVIYKTPK